MSLTRREVLFGVGATLIITPSLGGVFRKLFTGSRLKKMTWYRIFEAWDEKGNSVPLLGEGESIPKHKDYTAIRPVYVFRTDRKRQVAQALARSQVPLHSVSYESTYCDEVLLKHIRKIVA